MNEIIAKLYDQAIVIEDGGDYVCGELDPVKFAELIVRECLKQVRDEVQYLADWDKAGQVVSAVKKHFGVKE
jgi:hypothetical protein